MMNATLFILIALSVDLLFLGVLYYFLLLAGILLES